MNRLLGYQYVVLRVVPSAVREEFLNVGVVLYCQQSDFLQLAWEVNNARLHAFSAHLDPADVRAALRAASAMCSDGVVDGHPRLVGLGPRFGWLAAPRSTVLRPGPGHGGLTTDPAGELQRLLAVLVQV